MLERRNIIQKLERGFDDYLFRASSIQSILVGSEYKGITEKQNEFIGKMGKKIEAGGQLTDKQQKTYTDYKSKRDNRPAPSLSEGAKTYLKKQVRKVVFSRDKDIQSKHTRKGHICEGESLTLMSKYFGRLLLKNEKEFRNEWVAGIPDNVQGMVLDAKTNWTFEQHPMFEDSLKNKDYISQVQTYMWLTGFNKAKVVYCLVDTPEQLIYDECWKEARKRGIIDWGSNTKFIEEVESLHTYSDIPMELRVRSFDVEKESGFEERAKGQIRLARKYMNSLAAILLDRLK